MTGQHQKFPSWTFGNALAIQSREAQGGKAIRFTPILFSHYVHNQRRLEWLTMVNPTLPFSLDAKMQLIRKNSEIYFGQFNVRAQRQNVQYAAKFIHHFPLAFTRK